MVGGNPVIEGTENFVCASVSVTVASLGAVLCLSPRRRAFLVLSVVAARRLRRGLQNDQSAHARRPGRFPREGRRADAARASASRPSRPRTDRASAARPGRRRGGRRRPSSPRSRTCAGPGSGDLAEIGATGAGRVGGAIAPPLHAPVLYRRRSCPTRRRSTGSTRREGGCSTPAIKVGAARPAGVKPVSGRRLRGARGRDRQAGRPRAGRPSVVIASADQPDCSMPGGLGGESATRCVDQRTRSPQRPAPRSPRTAGEIYVLGPPAVISDAGARRSSTTWARRRRIAGKDPVANAIAFARFRTGTSAGKSWTPGTGSSSVGVDRPLDAAAAAPLSARPALRAAVARARRHDVPVSRVQATCSTSSPATRSDPVRGVYHHGWIIGDDGDHLGQHQASIDPLLEISPSTDRTLMAEAGSRACAPPRHRRRHPRAHRPRRTLRAPAAQRLRG